MKIKVDFFKPSGKWYASGTAELPDGTYIWTPNIRQIIMANQDCLRDKDDTGYWTIVTDNIDENYASGTFFKHTYLGDDSAETGKKIMRTMDVLFQSHPQSRELFVKSPTYNAFIQVLARDRDKDPLYYIAEACIALEEQNKKFMDYIDKYPNF